MITPNTVERGEFAFVDQLKPPKLGPKLINIMGARVYLLGLLYFAVLCEAPRGMVAPFPLSTQ
jgi:hypothetical protein